VRWRGRYHVHFVFIERHTVNDVWSTYLVIVPALSISISLSIYRAGSRVGVTSHIRAYQSLASDSVVVRSRRTWLVHINFNDEEAQDAVNTSTPLKTVPSPFVSTARSATLFLRRLEKGTVRFLLPFCYYGGVQFCVKSSKEATGYYTYFRFLDMSQGTRQWATMPVGLLALFSAGIIPEHSK